MPGTLFGSTAKQRVCPHIGMRPKTTCLSPYLHAMVSSTDFGNRRLEQGTICGPCCNPGATPNNEPVTLL
ncbi:MAG: hypothetical protein GX456_04295 [Verrucomicrobia bacterium]|nr:hypothetical protein [Verrucomicrobiota bacterium]